MTAQTGVYVNQSGSWVKVVEKDLVLEFNTDLGDTTIEMPLDGTVDCTVDWGDGTRNNYTTTGTKSHTYASGGTYTVRVSGLLTNFGGNSPTIRPELTRCLSFGEVGLTSLQYAFMICDNLVSVPKYLPQSSKITDIRHIFHNVPSFNQDLNEWDVSEVVDFGLAFAETSQFNGNIKSWDTSNAEYMDLMFFNASSFNQDLSGWCVKNISNKPASFDEGATAWTKPRPVWGTCP